MEIPRQLIDAFRDRRAAVFLGAGVSVSAGLPGWQESVAALAQQLNFPDSGAYSTDFLVKVPQYYENQLGRRELQRRLEELLQPPNGSKAHDLIARLPCELYYTTNFDELLERSLTAITTKGFPIIASEQDAQYRADYRGLQVRKIHGTITRPDGIVITRKDFVDIRSKSPVMVETLRSHLRSNSFLFIGYSLTDPDFAAIYDDVLLTMGELPQKHFVCTAGVTDFEQNDLRQRGLEVLDVLDWDPRHVDPTAGLTAFLDDLLTHTDDLAHLTRFFSDLKRGRDIPIIISSQPHPDEKYIYIAESDLVVASQANNVLEQLGCAGLRTADYRALQDFDRIVQDDLILVCSPFGNAFTHRVYELAGQMAAETFSRVRFEQTEKGRAIVVDDEKRFDADDPLRADGSSVRREYALLARYQNPWNQAHSIFVLAGLHAIGTHAVGRFLESNDNFRKLPTSSKRLEVILTVEFKSHEPYEYAYDIADVYVVGHSNEVDLVK